MKSKYSPALFGLVVALLLQAGSADLQPASSGIFRPGSARSKVAIGFGHDLLLSC